MPARLLLALLLALAFPAPAGASDAAGELAAFAAPLARATSREVALFNWLPAKNIGPAPIALRDPRARGYAAWARATFGNPPASDPSALGPGLYAAIDPVSTRQYGGDDAVLIQLALPAGTRFLALDSGPDLPTPLAGDLKAAGCEVYSLEALFQLAAREPKCRALRDELVSRLGLAAIRYPFTAAPLPYCPSRPAYAFLIIDDRAANLPGMLVFATKAADPGPEAALIEAVFESTGAPLWDALKGKAPDPKPWAKSHLLGCGSYPEDR